MLARPSGLADADPLLTVSVSGTIRKNAFGFPDVAFRSLPTVHAVTLTSAVHPVTAAQEWTHT